MAILYSKIFDKIFLRLSNEKAEGGMKLSNLFLEQESVYSKEQPVEMSS